MKLSFDFDSTLSKVRTQKLALKFIQAGHEVWIVTTRFEVPPVQADWNNIKLFAIAEALGIPRERIKFTGMVDKYNFLHDFDAHYDDDNIEIELIEEHCPNCVGVLIK